MGVGGHRHGEGRGQSTKKKKEERAPNICTPPLTVSFLHEASSGPGQGRENSCWGGTRSRRSCEAGGLLPTPHNLAQPG